MAKKKKPVRRRKKSERAVGRPQATDTAAADEAKARVAAHIAADDGAVLATYREPFGGDACRPRGAADRPRRADAVPARSVGAARQAADERHRNDRPLPRSDHRGPARRRATGRRTATTGCRRCGSSARRPSIALVVPEPEVAFKILALNTEKAHNLREKSLETIRMLRALADERGSAREREFAFEFEQPAFLTLGAAYEERPRLSGGAYQSMLRRIDDFLDESLPRR